MEDDCHQKGQAIKVNNNNIVKDAGLTESHKLGQMEDGLKDYCGIGQAKQVNSPNIMENDSVLTKTNL